MSEQTTEKVHVEFYRSWRAFPHTKIEGRPDDIMVTVSPNGPGKGGDYEFSIEHVGTESKYREPIALRVQLFADSWRAFADLPEFFALLGELDESQRPIWHSSRAPKATLDDLTPRLLALGWSDITDRFAKRHEHLVGCLTCGERDITTPPGATS